MEKHQSAYLAFDASYEESQLVLFGAPFDGTTSFRPGTRFGPMSARQEFYGIETYSPYQDDDLEERALFDSGDLEFPFGNKERVFQMIHERANTIVQDGKIPFMVGGEHLVTLPAVEAVFNQYPDLHIIHFDAHADLRDDYMGERFSHATVIRRCWDVLGDGRIHQFGIRSGSKEEIYWGREHVETELFSAQTLQQVIGELKGKPVYLTVDLDVLDPSVFPGTGTIEPGGLTFKEFIDCIVLMKELNVVGADVVELSPHYDTTGLSTAVACKVIREIVLAITDRR